MDRTKPHVQVFMLLPEPEPKNFYLKNDIGFQSEEFLVSYFSKISHCRALIEIENYQGFYDAENVAQFIQHYNVLDDYYMKNPGRVLRSLLKGWINWRDERISSEEAAYILLHNTITDESFSEAVARFESGCSSHNIVVSHRALNIPTNCSHEIESSGNSVSVACIELIHLPEWFSAGRIPQRNYNINPKHGENGRGEWTGASKLLCSHDNAREQLNQAMGVTEIDELYSFDQQHSKFIVFLYEGNIPTNQYHAYHIENNADVPKSIKMLFEKLRKLKD